MNEIDKFSMPAVPEITDTKQANMACAYIDSLEGALKAQQELDDKFAQFIDYSISVYREVAAFYKRSGERPGKHRNVIEFFMHSCDIDIKRLREHCLDESVNLDAGVRYFNSLNKAEDLIAMANYDYAKHIEEYDDTGVTQTYRSFKYPKSNCLAQIKISEIRNKFASEMEKRGAVCMGTAYANPRTESGKKCIEEYVVNLAERVEQYAEEVTEFALYLDNPYEVVLNAAPHIRWTACKEASDERDS